MGVLRGEPQALPARSVEDIVDDSGLPESEREETVVAIKQAVARENGVRPEWHEVNL